MWSYTKIIMWGVLWLAVWIIAAPLRRSRTNCLSWAIEQWDQQGGYLVIRWCRHSKVPWIAWPHFLWLPEQYHVYLQHVIPEDELSDEDMRTIPKAWFEPKQIQGDPENVKEN